MLLEVGDKLKRQYHDFQEVTVVSVGTQYIQVKDTSGMHFVPASKIETYFKRVKPDQVVKVPIEVHQNLDDHNRHNIAGAMNRPDRAAEARKK